MAFTSPGTVIFSSLPASLAGQALLLRGLGFGQLFAPSPVAGRVCDAYLRVDRAGVALPQGELSCLIDQALQPRLTGPSLTVPLHLLSPPEAADWTLQLTDAAPSSPSISGSGLVCAAGESGAADTRPTVSVPTAPAELVRLVESEFGMVVDQYRGVESRFEGEEQRAIEVEIGLIGDRVRFWSRTLTESERQPGPLARPYGEDILLGTRILLHRVLALAASVFQEPIPELPELKEEPLVATGETERERRILPALRNRDVGFGMELSLREHQVFLLQRVRGLLRRMMMETIGAKTALARELREGTIVMPQGGGKTRTMVACFGAAIETGLFDARRGDKLIILNHTEEIHFQNLQVAQLLGPFFEKRFGRPLRVTEYKARQKDLSGDVVVVSIPTVSTEGARRLFERRLREELGERGQVGMVAVDEIHHLSMGKGQTKESWREMIGSLRRVSPDLLRIGFTATPTGREGPYIGKVYLPDLMRSGVTPRTYLRQVAGADLSSLKVSVGYEDVSVRRLVSVLLQHPDRNGRLYEALEKDGLRSESVCPSGRERLEPSLSFAADLRHARMMAEAYLEYFGQRGDGLRGRRLALLGGERGEIERGELEEALHAYRGGRSDGIVAIVSGDTPRKMRDEILAAVVKGEVEAVFNVDVWAEGADLYPFTHLLGARPTFSRIKKGQEMGRLNRRGPDDVGEDGELACDRPKILFDVVDTYRSFDRSLVFYANLLGVGSAVTAAVGQLFDVFNGNVVDAVDREGLGVVHQRLREVLGRKKGKKGGRPRPPRAEPVWGPILARLEEVLQTTYGGDMETMASDLAMSEEEVEGLLAGRGLIDARWFLRRLATLLYQPRETFVSLYNEIRELGDRRVTDSDIELLWGAMAVYARREGRGVEGEVPIVVDGKLPGWGGQRTTISQHAQRHLNEGAITDRVFRLLWKGLYLYFSLQREGGPETGRGEAEAWRQRLRSHLFAREGWDEATATARQRLLLRARDGFAIVFGGRFPQNRFGSVPKQLPHSSLWRWLAGGEIAFGRGLPPHDFYKQVQTLLRYFGMAAEEIENLVVAAVYEDQGWRDDLSTPAGRLLALTRRRVAVRFGGRLPTNTGLPGVPEQYAAYHERGKNYEAAPLTRWLAGEEIVFNRGLPEREFSRQVRALLSGVSSSPKRPSSPP